MDIFEELKGYKELLDSDIITQEEFDKKKAELLSINVPTAENSHQKKSFAEKSLNETPPKEPQEKTTLAFNKRITILVVILIIVAGIGVAVMIKNENKKARKSSSSSSGTSYSYEMDHNTYSLLYMNVSNVSVTHSGNYAYVSGTITNNGTYSVRYVKVKAACKDLSGSVIDTDWTYAVDSSWLEPGESKSFEMMVKDTGKRIKTASVTVEF